MHTVRSRTIGLGLVALMLALAALACSIAGGDDDPELSPTTAPALTATVTQLAVGALPSPTPFPTPTQRPFATATPFVLPRPNTALPTWTPLVPTATPLPYDVRIAYPVGGSQVQGYVTVTGSASHPRFVQYALEWGPEPNPSNLWYQITAPRTAIVLNGILGAWNTTSMADGNYQLRLHVWLADGTDTAFVAGGVRVSNAQPTAVPTATHTPRPNQNPVVSAIANQQLGAGQSTRIVIQASDPDGDTPIMLPSSNNPAVATAQLETANELVVRGHAAGSAVITLNVNDNRGGVASTVFTVTVTGQNRPPVLNPIANQAVAIGQTHDVMVQASDPDGDPITLSATSSDSGVLSVGAPTNAIVRMVGQGEGTASVTVSASDGRSGAISTVFLVTVGLANRSPSIDPIAAQALNVDETRDVSYHATDPDGDTLEAGAVSNNPGVVAASVVAPGVIRLAAAQPGIASVVLTVHDRETPPVTTTFEVTVQQPDRPPVVDAIGAQSITVGDVIDVPYRAEDPDDNALNQAVESSNPGVVTAEIPSSGLIRLRAQQAGAATVTLRVDDGVGAAAVEFPVTVGAANVPPSITAIDAQALRVGDVVDVPFTATDPDGDTLSVEAISENAAIASAEIPTDGLLRIRANGAGQVTVTLSASDGANPPVVVNVPVTVSAPNEVPLVEPVGEQRLAAGETITVSIHATDPNGDLMTVMAVSHNPAVASAEGAGMGVVVTGNAEGTATIAADIIDAQGGTAPITFMVIVEGSNRAPVIDPVAPQQLTVGETIEIPLAISDEDGDTIVLTAIAQDQTIATAQAVGTDTVMLTGVGEGVTTVDLTADDAQGGVTLGSFTVTVAAAPAGFDLSAYPVIPQIDAQPAAMLGQVYQSGVSNFGNKAGAFSKVGDESVAGEHFMAPLAGEQVNLGNFGALQGLLDLYRATPVRGDDPAINSLTVSSTAAESGFGIDSLGAPAAAGAACGDGSASTALGCEYIATRPAIALISFRAENVTYLPPEQFRAELQTLVMQSLSEYGVIPVLATIPADSSATTEQLAEYNRAIVEVATQSGVPLWNLWRAMNERGISDPFGVAPEGAGFLTDAALSYGANVRNLTALQTLHAVRQAADIQ